MPTSPGATRLLLVGSPDTEFTLAAVMARDAGAEVVAVDGVIAAMAVMRTAGADLAMIDVDADVAAFITQLRHEHIALPVYACGVNARATSAVAAIRAGARDYLPLPPNRELIAAAIMAVIGESHSSVGHDPVLARTTALGLALAPTRTSILITGEPGSGRQSLARTIHAASGRAGRFIVLDCGEIDVAMIDSELFGHQAGTFPGAVARRCGRIEAAANGTLLMREVTHLPLTTQSRLSELLESQAYGGGRGEFHPARLMASTAFDLDARVADGRFRANLLAQLGLVRLTVPPLRQRGDDVMVLARHFGERFAKMEGLPVRAFTDAAAHLLRGHDWPGNVRELSEVVHRAVLISPDDQIAASAIMLADGGVLARRRFCRLATPTRAEAALHGRLNGLVGSTVEDVERALILETLSACSGNRTSASTILGISVRTMRNKLKTFVEAGIPVHPTL